ncbi:MAG TPA: hypothetical protein VGK33_18715 [Chloroflexota bacterium]
MRKHLIWASATLALALGAIGAVSACGSPGTATASPTPSCVNATAPHHAYVVVQHLSGATTQKCVGFSSDTIDGQSLMDSSTIEYQAQTFSFGKAVCQVDREPLTFTACFPQNQPYWALFVETNGTWASAQNGYTQVTLHDKDALGWRYVSAADQSPSPPPQAKE